MRLPASSRRLSQVAPRAALAIYVIATVIGGSSLTNNGSMVASANGGQGHIGSSISDAALLFVETVDRGATLTNNKTILGAATSGGSTFVEV